LTTCGKHLNIYKVLEGIEAFIPGPNKYSTWKKDSWKCPLYNTIQYKTCNAPYVTKMLFVCTIQRCEITNQKETSHVD